MIWAVGERHPWWDSVSASMQADLGQRVGFPIAVRHLLLSHFTVSIITILRYDFSLKKHNLLFEPFTHFNDRVYGLSLQLYILNSFLNTKILK